MTTRTKPLRFQYPALTPQHWRYNRRHQFAEYFTQHIYYTNSIFTFIPKNACSSLRYSIALANGVINDQTDIAWIYANHTTFKPDIRTQLLAAYAFVFLRCPFSRLASAFLDQLVKRPHIYIAGRRRKGFTKYVLDPIFSRVVTFEKFVYKLYTDSEFLRSNAHWTPQVDFLLFDEYDEYFCVEEMGTAVKTLKARIDLEVVDARPLSKHGIDGYTKVEVINGHQTTLHEVLEMKKHNTVIHPRYLYSDPLIEIVKAIYKDDINLYIQKFGSKNLLFPV